MKAFLLFFCILLGCGALYAENHATRYDLASVAEGKLCNVADLPASPIRTDIETHDTKAQSNRAATPAIYCNPLPLPDYPIGRAAQNITNGEALDNSGGWLLEHKEQFRELADPTAIWEGGSWYLYPSVDMAWVSADKGVTWQHHPLNLRDIGYAPTVVKNQGKFLLLASGSALYAADSPLGEFKEIGRIELPVGVPAQVDPMLFSDDDGKLFYYWGCSRASGIWAVELDASHPTKILGQPIQVVPFDPVKQPWEAVGEWNQNPNMGWVEGAWMLKRNGKYYLTFSAAGTENRTYAMGCYTANLPLGPFTAQKRNPIFRNTSGLITGTAHGCIVAGPDDELWAFYTIRGGVANAFERRIGMDRAQMDANGELFVPAATSVPQWVSHSVLVDHSSAPDWLPLNTGMQTLGSSCAPNLPGRFAVDDEMRTWWQPATDDPQPTLTSKFIGAAVVQAVRIIWRDVGLDTQRGVIPGPFRYRVEICAGGDEWKTLIDGSASTEDFLIDYRECPQATGVAARLILTGHPNGITPAVAEFTVFGKVTATIQNNHLLNSK
jgi:xylan 1,4-beta-xylosidase